MNAVGNVDLPTVWTTRPSHPGESLSATMERRGVSPGELAEATGESVESVNQIVKGKGSISPEFADALGAVFDGIPAQFWHNRQFLYDAALEHNEENDRLYRPQLPVFKRHFPNTVYNELVEQGYVFWDAPPAERVRAVCEMFGTDSLAEVCDTQPEKRFRSSPVKAGARGALSAWLWKGEQLAEQRARQISNTFNRERLLQVAVKLRGLTSASLADSLESIGSELSTAGVVFIALPHIKRCGVRGASWRLDSGHHAIQVNDHGKKADRFWFTLFHEIGHVINGDESSLDSDTDDGTVVPDDERELAADKFAQDLLIPPGDWSSFEIDFPFTRAKITGFAEQSGVHPGIVAGRLAKLQKISWPFADQFTSPFELPISNAYSERLRIFNSLVPSHR